MGRASGYVTARLATNDEAHLLGVELPAALLVESRTITDTTGRIIENTQSAYVGSRWVIDTGSFVAPVTPSQTEPEDQAAAQR